MGPGLSDMCGCHATVWLVLVRAREWVRFAVVWNIAASAAAAAATAAAAAAAAAAS
jgi:hypothetical protein